MTAVTEAGAVVLPAAPGFYHRPERIEQLVDFVVQRILDQVGVDVKLVPRWGGAAGKRAGGRRKPPTR
jgi:4-hydroxy-3-polyprenylbenzoate decarboxylase